MWKILIPILVKRLQLRLFFFEESEQTSFRLLDKLTTIEGETQNIRSDSFECNSTQGSIAIVKFSIFRKVAQAGSGSINKGMDDFGIYAFPLVAAFHYKVASKLFRPPRQIPIVQQ